MTSARIARPSLSGRWPKVSIKTIPARLEDFGTQHMPAPKDRFIEYRRQCLELPRNKQAAFWMRVMREDPEVAALTNYKVTRRGRRT